MGSVVLRRFAGGSEPEAGSAAPALLPKEAMLSLLLRPLLPAPARGEGCSWELAVSPAAREEEEGWPGALRGADAAALPPAAAPTCCCGADLAAAARRSLRSFARICKGGQAGAGV